MPEDPDEGTSQTDTVVSQVSTSKGEGNLHVYLSLEGHTVEGAGEGIVLELPVDPRDVSCQGVDPGALGKELASEVDDVGMVVGVRGFPRYSLRGIPEFTLLPVG